MSHRSSFASALQAEPGTRTSCWFSAHLVDAWDKLAPSLVADHMHTSTAKRLSTATAAMDVQEASPAASCYLHLAPFLPLASFQDVCEQGDRVALYTSSVLAHVFALLVHHLVLSFLCELFIFGSKCGMRPVAVDGVTALNFNYLDCLPSSLNYLYWIRISPSRDFSIAQNV